MKPNPHQFEQLPMFMTANEILKTHDLADQVYSARSDKPTKDQVLAEKLADSKDPLARHPGYLLAPGESLYDSIASSGITHPVHLAKLDETSRMVMDGHHRLAVQHDLDPDAPVIPVQHS